MGPSVLSLLLPLDRGLVHCRFSCFASRRPPYTTMGEPQDAPPHSEQPFIGIIEVRWGAVGMLGMRIACRRHQRRRCRGGVVSGGREKLPADILLLLLLAAAAVVIVAAHEGRNSCYARQWQRSTSSATSSSSSHSKSQSIRRHVGGARTVGNSAALAFVPAPAQGLCRSPAVTRNRHDVPKKLPRTATVSSRASHRARPPSARSLASATTTTTTTTDLPPVQEHKVLVASSPHPIEMQVLTQLPPPPLPYSGIASAFNLWRKDNKTATRNKPMLLLLHGSFHGAWCYTEHWFEHFVQLGYPVAALSWRGTGATFAGPGVAKVKIAEHVHDLRTILHELPALVYESDEAMMSKEGHRGVVLVSHSFGGLAVMKLFEAHPELLSPSEAPTPPIVGVVTMCSVPPSGNGPMTLRYLRRSLKQSWKITAGFAMKRCCDDANLCRELFFGGDGATDTNMDDGGVTDDDVKRYQTYFRRDSEATIDLVDLAKQLPSAQASKVDGTAPYVTLLPPCLAVGASRDYIVDHQGVLETAKYFGVPVAEDNDDEDNRNQDRELVIVDSPHDVMLGKGWRNGADAIERWLSRHEL